MKDTIELLVLIGGMLFLNGAFALALMWCVKALGLT